MADSDPRLSPNAEPKARKNAKVFQYDVSSQGGTAPKPGSNPASPLAAG